MSRRHQASKRFREKRKPVKSQSNNSRVSKDCVSSLLDSQQEKRKTATPSHVQPGDVFIMRDNGYDAENKHKEVPDTQVIRYDRPVVVMATSRSTVNVLPLSTKIRPFDTLYPVVIEQGLESQVIISQTLTVDFDNLADFIGTLRPDVFHDMREALSKYVLHGASHVKRTVQRYEMDMVKYEPFGIYVHQLTNERFMMLKTKKKTFIKVPVEILKENDILPTDVKVFCGHVRLHKVQLVLPDELCDDHNLLYIGEEYRKSIRKKIVDTISSCLGVKIRNCMLKPDSIDIKETMAIAKVISSSDYINGVKVIDDICRNHVKVYLDDPQTFVKKAFKKLTTFTSPTQLIDVINERILLMSDMLVCDTRVLGIGEKNFADILERRLSKHSKGFICDSKGVVTKYNNTDRKYYLKNVRWIYKYHQRNNKK